MSTRYTVVRTTLGWAVIDTVLDAIASGAESEGMAREIATQYEVAFPNGVE